MLQIKIGGCREFESLKVSEHNFARNKLWDIPFHEYKSAHKGYNSHTNIFHFTTWTETETDPSGSGQDNETAKLLIASSVFVINSIPLIGKLRPLLGASDWRLVLPSEIPSEHLILRSQHMPAWSIMNTEVMTSGWCWRKDMEMLTLDAAPPYVCSHTTFRRLVNILQVIRSFLSFPGCLSPNIYRH